ncbi:hypothetical protein ACWDKQ_32340 [Saccharopolyspora sp. NPDC000995]
MKMGQQLFLSGCDQFHYRWLSGHVRPARDVRLLHFSRSCRILTVQVRATEEAILGLVVRLRAGNRWKILERLYVKHRRRHSSVSGSQNRRSPFWRALRATLAVLGAFAVVIAGSIGHAFAAPGNASAAARLAEWGRDHGLGSVITYLEQMQYDVNKPTVGGAPQGGIPKVGIDATSTGGPAPMPNLAGGTPLPGEGQWQTVATVRGKPAIRVALVRPDTQHTSYLAAAMWIDPKLVSGQLRPGFQDPGGNWPEPDVLTHTDQESVLAAFNAGFRLPRGDSHGGYYSDGRTVFPLVNGAASLVMLRNGTAEVGSWNQEVHLTPDVASVRQNLVMLVDNRQLNPTCDTGGSAEWGVTVGNKSYIDRSAFGITASGAEVYVAGPALSVCTLGHILQGAGVVRGMEMDINPDWISGAYFDRAPNGLVGHRLYPAQKLPPTHYLAPTSRDWYAWFPRSTSP